MVVPHFDNPTGSKLIDSPGRLISFSADMTPVYHASPPTGSIVEVVRADHSSSKAQQRLKNESQSPVGVLIDPGENNATPWTVELARSRLGAMVGLPIPKFSPYLPARQSKHLEFELRRSRLHHQY